MNFNFDQICHIGGCVLIFALLVLLIMKPQGIMSIFEGQNANANNSAPNNSNKNVNSGNNNAAARNNNNAAARNNNAARNNAGPRNNNNSKPAVQASLPLGDNEQFASVSGITTPT